jgi:hypothetical protein
VTSINVTHTLELAIYFSASNASLQQQAPILVKRFVEKLNNHDFARLLSIYPDRGDYKGGTPLTIKLDSNPMLVKSRVNLTCRIASK